MDKRNDYIYQAYDIAQEANELERINLALKLCETVRPISVSYDMRWIDRVLAFVAGAALTAFALVVIGP